MQQNLLGAAEPLAIRVVNYRPDHWPNLPVVFHKENRDLFATTIVRVNKSQRAGPVSIGRTGFLSISPSRPSPCSERHPPLNSF